MALSQAHDVLTASDWIGPAFRELSGALWSRINWGTTGCGCRPGHRPGPEAGAGAGVGGQRNRHQRVEIRALSKPSGQVDVSWRVGVGENAAFAFVWREKGGPPVVAPSREGFGSRVIKTSLADDFGGSVELAYEPAGFVCTLTAPLDNLPRAAALL
jgi:hypothetical protein